MSSGLMGFLCFLGSDIIISLDSGFVSLVKRVQVFFGPLCFICWEWGYFEWALGL